VCIKLENPLGIGAYSLTLALHKGLTHHEGCYHWLDNAAFFAVASTGKRLFEGSIDCRANIQLLNEFESK